MVCRDANIPIRACLLLTFDRNQPYVTDYLQESGNQQERTVPFLSRVVSFTRNIFRKDERDHELDNELRSQLGLMIDENVRKGLTPDEARRAAIIELGVVEQVKEHVRAARTGAWLDSLLQDIRFGLRMLRKSPGFTIVALLTLALGIGINTAVFSIVDSVILRPLPYKDSSRLAVVRSQVALFPTFRLGISWPTFQEIRKEVPGFEQSAVYRQTRMKLSRQDAADMLQVANVSGDFFEQLGASQQIGRLLAPHDMEGNTSQAAVISNSLWRTRFGSNDRVLGQTLALDDKQYVVVGVAKSGFDFPERTDLWIPMALSSSERQNFTNFNFLLIGKLRANVKLDTLNAQLRTVAERIRGQSPDFRNGYDLSAQLLMESRVGNVRKGFFLLLAATTLLLLIACSNVASLLLARGSGRQHEMALRAALGASRLRIVRQVLIESLLLAVAGGTVGIALAIGGVSLFRNLAPPDTARLGEISVNASLLWVAFATAIAAGLIFGIAPACHASSVNPNATIKEGDLTATGAPRQSRLSAAVVVIEVALSFVLLAGAGLFIRSLSDLLRVDTGMRTDHLLTFTLPQGDISPTMSSGERDAAITSETGGLRQVLDRIKTLPGVQSVAASDHLILNGSMWMRGGLQVEGAAPPPKGAQRVAYSRAVSPTYFQSLGIPLIRGRAFAENDIRGGQLVAIVNEAMARAYWGTPDVIGKHISIEKDSKGNPEWAEVVGIVADTRDIMLAAAPQPEYYLPVYQLWTASPQIIVRTANDPVALAGVISKNVWAATPDQPVTDVQVMAAVIAQTVAEPRWRAILLGIFAGFGILLALLGIYGLLAYGVSRRTREIGIRIALGAESFDIVRLVIFRGFVLAFVGTGIGIGVSLALFRIIASELFSVKPTDPFTLTATAILMLVTAGLASYIPAWRAMRVDPMVALRHE